MPILVVVVVVVGFASPGVVDSLLLPRGVLREIYEQVSCNSARTISVNHTPSPD